MKRKFARLTAAFLAAVMLFLAAPLTAIDVGAFEEIDFDDPLSNLGRSFNALSGESITAYSINPQKWIRDDDDIVVYSTKDFMQYTNANYATSSLELLTKLGMDQTTSIGGSFVIKGLKLGLDTKMGESFDLSQKITTSEAYYYYTLTAIQAQYELENNYSEYLSEEFLSAIESLQNELSEETKEQKKQIIEAFFEEYGTHMLTQFNIGAQLDMYAWAVSESSTSQLDKELTEKVELSIGIDSIASISAADEIKDTFSEFKNSEGYSRGIQLTVIGGNKVISTTDDYNSYDKKSMEQWAESVKENGAFLPDTSEWVAVWDVLPAKYSNLANELYEYYMVRSDEVSSKFLSKYCSLVTVTGYEYISPTGYTFQNVAYKVDGGSNYVAPGSIVNLKLSALTKDRISVDVSTELNNSVEDKDYKVDRNGVIKIGTDAEEGRKLTVRIKAGGITVKTLTFEIMHEGAGDIGDPRFFGGYGDADRPYLIEDAEHLKNLSDNSGNAAYNQAGYLLINDIDMTGTAFSGIKSFSGTFDGNGHSVYGFNINSTDTSIGFIYVNSGTVKNLTLGKAGDISVNNHSARVGQTVAEKSYGNTQFVGGLAGKNTTNGVIDNCHIINMEVFGQLDDENDNITSYSNVGGIAGNNNGVIIRSSISHSHVESYMDTVLNSGDNNDSRAGGICARNYGGRIEYCISHSNTLKATALGNGKNNVVNDNEAKPRARVGGLIAYQSGEGNIVNCNAAFHNKIESKADSNSGVDNYTKPKHWAGYLFGQLAVVGSVSNNYATADVTDGLWANGANKNDDKVCICDSMDELKGNFANVKAFHINSEGNLTINTTVPDTGINAKNCYAEKIDPMKDPEEPYVVGDNLNVLDMIVNATTASGDKFRQYDEATGTLTNVDFDQFHISGFTSDEAGNYEITVTSYGGKTTTFTVTVIDVADEAIAIGSVPRTAYYVGDTLNTTGLSVFKVKNNGEYEEISDLAGITFSGYDMNTAGRQTVTVSYNGFTATYDITVYAVKPTGISIATLPAVTSYAVGDAFDPTGLTVEVKYNNGSSVILDSGFVCTGFDSAEEGSKDITVSYTVDQDEPLTATFSVNIGSVSSIAIVTEPEKKQYYTGDSKIDPAGLTLEVTYSNSVKKTVTSGYTVVKDYDLTTAGIKDITVSYEGCTASFEIEVIKKELASIEITAYPKTNYYIGDTFSVSGLCINRIYNNGSTEMAWSGYTVAVEGYDEGVLPVFTSTGNKKVTVYYAEAGQRKSAEYEIKVSAVILERIEIAQPPYKTVYKQNDTLNTEGMIIQAVFNNGNVMTVTDYIPQYNFSSLGESQVVIWYNNVSVSYDVTVRGPSKLVITSYPDKSEYTEGDTLDLTGLAVSAVYFDGTSVPLSIGELSVGDVDMNTVGNQTVTLTCGELSATFDISINKFEVTDPSLAKVVLSLEAPTNVFLNKAFSLNIYIAGTYDGYSFVIPEYDGFAIESVATANSGIKADEIVGGYRISVLPGLAKTDAERELVVTVNYKVDENTDLGQRTLDLTDVGVSNESGDREPSVYVTSAYVNVKDGVPGDINGDGIFDYFDVTKLFAYYRGIAKLDSSADVDVNGDGAFDYFDVTKLFAIYRGKASF